MFIYPILIISDVIDGPWFLCFVEGITLYEKTLLWLVIIRGIGIYILMDAYWCELCIDDVWLGCFLIIVLEHRIFLIAMIKICIIWP